MKPAGRAAGLAPAKALFFDWHGTLVDTRAAMYRAMDDMLAHPAFAPLLQRLVLPGYSRTVEDARLVRYVREHRSLHPRLLEEGRVSRTDILEILFGNDEQAKAEAHALFSECYRQHFGAVHLLETGARDALLRLREAGIRTGILTNRDREFLERELDELDGGGWPELFDVIVCGGDAAQRKPSPDIVLMALHALELEPGPDSWLVGDSASDVAAAKRAGIASVFFNSARWSSAWLARYFPCTPEHPHVPDAIVSDFRELERLVTCTAAILR